MDWGKSETNRGVTERGFSVSCQGRNIPGILWTPESTNGPTPLVLIGHGGSGHKREDHLLSLARRFVRHNGIAAATIDGPVHGDRQVPDDMEKDFANYSYRLAGKRVAKEMTEDWKATLDALQKLPEIGIGRVGYWGLSMGTIYGLPFVASEPRIDAAVLGLMGAIKGFEHLGTEAPNVSCPVLFLQQWDDELIPREASSELFGALGTKDKRLHAHPGLHAAVPGEEFLNTQAFLAGHLLTHE